MENEDETKTHLQVGSQGERGMTGHLRALISGQGTPHHIWDGVDVIDQHITQTLGVLPQWQSQNRHEPGGALYQGRCR